MIALVAALAHGINMFNYPLYLMDEGTYTADAWAVLKEARLDPYSYTYGHAPAGWFLIAAWAVLTGGFHTFGPAIDSGRALMLILQVGSTCMLYHIARSISHSITVASATCLLFALSPYAVYFHREVLLDNIATFWMLLSIMLLVSRRLSLSRVWLSAGALGLSILSKENTIFVAPALTFLVFYRADRSHRWFATIGWPVIVGSLVSIYVLMAALKGELFPAGTALGGSHPHVSLLYSLLWQTNREKDGGIIDFSSKFWQTTRYWVQADPLLVAGGSFAAFLAVLTIKRQRLVGLMGAATLSLWVFLARGSVTLDFYLLPSLPLLALSLALVLGLVANGVATLFTRYLGHSPIVKRIMQMVVVAWCVAGLTLAYSGTTLSLQYNPLFLWNSSRGVIAVKEAVTWTEEHIPACSRTIVDPIMWTDLHDIPNRKDGFRLAHMYWQAALDPAIRDGVFQNNWRNVDYEIVTPNLLNDIRTYPLQLVKDVWAHSTVVASFDQMGWPIEIRQVNNGKARLGRTCQSNHIRPYAIVPPGRVGPTTLYFAEGYTGRLSTNSRATFDESLTVHNTDPFTATVTITYLIQHGSPVVVTRTVGPHATRRESVNTDIGPDKIAAAVVSSAARITAERLIRRVGAGGVTLDASSTLGNANLGKRFYFAADDTGASVQEYLAVANPGSSGAHVRVTFASRAASSARASSETFTVPANGRATRNIRSDMVAMANKSGGLIVTSDQPMMAERVLYLGSGVGSAKYDSTANTSNSPAPTATAPATLVIHNSPRTAVVGSAERFSVHLPGQPYTQLIYILQYPDGQERRSLVRTDGHGYSSHTFNVRPYPARRLRETAAVSVEDANGRVLAFTRFAIQQR